MGSPTDVDNRWMELASRFLFAAFEFDESRKLVMLKDGYHFSSTDLWEDLQLLGVSRLGASAPNLAVFRGGIYGLEFVAGATNTVYGTIELPHAYKEGSDIQLHVHWKTNSTSAAGGGVRWEFEYSLTDPAPGSVSPAPSTITVTETVPAVDQQYLQHSFDIATISGAGLKISQLLNFRFSRLGADGADTFPASVWVDSVALHHQRDMEGSVQLWAKT